MATSKQSGTSAATVPPCPATMAADLLAWLDTHTTLSRGGHVLLPGFSHDWRTRANALYRNGIAAGSALSQDQRAGFDAFCDTVGIDRETLIFEATLVETKGGVPIETEPGEGPKCFHPVRDMQDPEVVAAVRASLALIVGATPAKSNATPEGKPEADGKPADAEANMQRIALAVGDEHAAEIIRIANSDQSAEKRMAAIIKIDPRMAAKDSPEWEMLLDVKNVRGLNTWKSIQRAKGKR